jgi:hypothetical protein
LAAIMLSSRRLRQILTQFLSEYKIFMPMKRTIPPQSS